MTSETIDDEWVAIKAFPFGSNVVLQELRGDAKCSSSANTVCKKPMLKVKWLNDDKRLLFCFKEAPFDQEIQEKRKHSAPNCVDQEEDASVDLEFSYQNEVSLEQFAKIHEEISLVCRLLEDKMPPLPTEPKGFWSYISQFTVPDNMEESIEDYLQTAYFYLGQNLFLQTYFNIKEATITEEEYLDSLGELNRKALADDVMEARNLLDDVLSLRGGSINIYDMLSLYDVEDEAKQRVDIAEVVLYNFDRQPFLELREVAHQRLRKKCEDVKAAGVSKDDKLQSAIECLDWQKQLKISEEHLLDLKVEYFKRSLTDSMDSRDRLIEDRLNFGQETFNNTKAKDRLVDKEKSIISLTVQLLRLKKLKLCKERKDIQEEILNVADSDEIEAKLEKFEKQFYLKQLQVFDTQLKILDKEEMLQRMELQRFVKDSAVQGSQINEIVQENDSDNEEFYEAYQEQPLCFEIGLESAVKGETEGESHSSREWTEKRDITNRLNKIFRKRAVIRNKKRLCELQRRMKIDTKVAEEDNFKLHHSIQLKRNRLKEEMEEKKDFIQTSRKKTIDRLRDYKKRYPDPVVKRPPRYLPPVRRTRPQSVSQPSFRPAGSNQVPGSSVSLKILTRYEEQEKENKDKTSINEKRGLKTKITGVSTEHQEKCLNNDSSKSDIPAISQAVPSLVPSPLASLSSPPSPPPPPPPPPLPPPPPPLQLFFEVSSNATEDPKSVSEVVGTYAAHRPKPLPRKQTDALSKKHREEASGKLPMDTASDSKIDLSSILGAKQRLRKVETTKIGSSEAQVTQDLLTLIRSGVKLKKVDFSQKKERQEGFSGIAESLLRNTLARMNKHTSDSSDEESEVNDDDF